MGGVGVKMMEGRSPIFPLIIFFSRSSHGYRVQLPLSDPIRKPLLVPTTVLCTRNKGTTEVRVLWNVGEPATQFDAQLIAVTKRKVPGSLFSLEGGIDTLVTLV